MNVLLVSIACPPKGDPESLQVHKYLNELLGFEDINISIVTSKNPTLFMDVDKELQLDMESCDQLIEVPIRESKYVNFVKRKIKPDWLNYPDSKVSFINGTTQVLKELKNVPDVIYSRSFPISSSLLALDLKRKYNCPWILHLSDPWILENDKSQSTVWNLEKELECFETADIIGLTSKKTIAFYKTRYPHLTDKFVFFPNVYSADQISTLPSVPERKKVVITYTGGLTALRNPETLLKALQSLHKKHTDLNERLEVRLVGPKDSYCEELIQKTNLSFVRNIGLVSYSESLKEQASSDYLLLMDSNFNKPILTMYFPSKILDYMSQFKPIIALTPAHSTSTEVIAEYKLGKAFDYSNEDQLTAYLETIIYGSTKINLNFTLPKELSASYNANRLYDVFLRYGKK
jgi:glycosyltransferase involved in cell wall biosynthesis